MGGGVEPNQRTAKRVHYHGFIPEKFGQAFQDIKLPFPTEHIFALPVVLKRITNFQSVLEFFNNLHMWARNRVGIGLSSQPATPGYTQPGRMGSLESIIGLLKSLKIQALSSLQVNF